jgi:phosphatidylserine decarboxylase
MTRRPDPVDVRRKAGWLPEQEDLEAWLSGHSERAESRADRPLRPAVREFQELIERDAIVRMYLERMLSEVPSGREYSKQHVQDVPQLLRLIDELLTMAPQFSESSMIATPLGAILDWTMGTPTGSAAFRDPRINAALKRILTDWCAFLDSPDSLFVLNDSETGWMSPAAREAIDIEQYEHDPDDEHWGFTSWNDFFTRRFMESQRPVASPDDDAVIVSPCESTPYGISTDVQRRDRFWIKSQPYSLEDMLDHDPSVGLFVGGTVYQAYLSATNYHRWHSPVPGTIVRAFNVDGTYYSEADTEGAAAVEPTDSQGYLVHVATRAVFVIEADDPAIGLVAFVPVGMSDVSSCRIRPGIEPGRHVAKGEELGTFQFGGSTYCLVLRPGVVEEFTLGAIPQPHDPEAPLMHVNAKLATARTGGSRPSR